MSKELAEEYNEEQLQTAEPILIEEEMPSEYIQLLQRLQKKEETLSYSSLKAFSKSPRNFIQYKLKPRSEQTESQIFGSLCDCFLTTPEKFDELFVIVTNFPTSENQKGFCADMISGKSKEYAYANNYKAGGVDKVWDALGSYVEAIQSRKMVCTTKMKDEAFKIVENLKKSELIMQYVDSCANFQVKHEWVYSGWKFKGFTDAEGVRIIIDFKYTADSDPDKFERDILKYKYYLQMGMYSEADGSLPECFFVTYDKSLNFSIIKLDFSLLMYGIREYKYLVAKLEQCIKENRWSESYNFFDVQMRTVYKPKWIKGFDTDDLNVE